MTSNIYLELELFLDPPITDAAALEAEINKKINNWHKMLSADPRNKVRVSKAKEYLARGLSDLQSQADAARTTKLHSLQNDIKKAGRVGGINDVKLKKLKSTYRTFFSERTIERECGGAGASSEEQMPRFVPPKRIDSLDCPKKISFKDMERLAEDLELIDGNPQNLYELLKGSLTDKREELLAKAKDLSERARKMPKTNSQADPLNRLAGKCLNFFKDDQNRRSYDIALKRFPFDTLCNEELHWNTDKENGVPWDVYQESILKTVQQGFTRAEAEWLVYEYYCVVQQCPDPIPELEKPIQPPTASPGIDWIEVAQKTGRLLGRFSGNAKSLYKKVRESLPTAPTQPIRQDQFDPPKSEDLQKIELLRKRFLQQKNPSTIYLNGLFEEVNLLAVQYQTAPEETLRHLKTFRAEVAEILGDRLYAEENFVLALQCYQAVLDEMPKHAKAGSRFRMIDGIKEDLYRQIQSAIAEKNYLACRQGIGELTAKFTGDPETEDFVRKIEKQIQETPVSKEYVQQLVNGNRWYTLANLLEGTKQQSYIKVLHAARKRLDQVDKNISVIRQTLRTGGFERVRQQLGQIRNFVADHPQCTAFEEEAKQFWDHAADMNSQFKKLIDKKQLIKGENILRLFVAEYPQFRQGLAGYAQLFAGGVTRFQNGLRFGLFSLLGGILFLVISFVTYRSVWENEIGNVYVGIVLSLGLGFLLTKIACSALIRVLFGITKTPLMSGGFEALIGTFMLFVLASFAGCLVFTPFIADLLNQYVTRIDGPDAATNVAPIALGLRCIVCWLFFWCLYIHVFYYFSRCLEDEKGWPFLYTLIGNTVFTALLLGAEQIPASSEILILALGAIFWGGTAFVAYLHFRKEMILSLADFKDYSHRSLLLRQYKGTDFEQPLLLTDWYQKALDLAQQQPRQQTSAAQARTPVPPPSPQGPRVPVPQVKQVPVPPVQK